MDARAAPPTFRSTAAIQTWLISAHPSDQTLFTDLPTDDPLRLPFTSAATTLTSFDIEALSVIGFGVVNAVSPAGGGGSDVLLQNSATVAVYWIYKQNGQYAVGIF